MKNVDYAQAVVLARIYEKRLINKAKFDRMIDAPDAHECFKILMDSDYSKSANNVFDVYGYVELLNQELVSLRNTARELLDDEKLFEIMTLKYEYHNLKVIAKSKYSDKDLTEKFISSKISNPFLMLAQVQADKYSNIKDEYARALKEAFTEYERTREPQFLDIVIDRHYFEHMTKLAEEVNIEYFTKYVQAEIDFYNVVSLVRMQKMGKTQLFADKVLIDNGSIKKTKLLSLLQADTDKLINELKMETIGDYVRKGLEQYKKNGLISGLEHQKREFLKNLNIDARFIAFGPEPIVAYILSKEEEIEKVRFIIVAKLNNINPEKIRERLGE